MIRLLRILVLFLVPFSFVFFLLHTVFGSRIFLYDLGGLPQLYATIGLIFGVVAAFVIQREWETWTDLDESVRTEIDTIREVWKWSAYAEKGLQERAHEHLRRYLVIIDTEWGEGKIKRNRSIDSEVDGLRDVILEIIATRNGSGLQLQEGFSDLIKARNSRLTFSTEHIPGILRRAVLFADVLVIILSLFIGVPNPYLDYAFTVSIGLLAFSLYVVIDDMDNPFRPGAWHLTTAGYKELVEELQIT